MIPLAFITEWQPMAPWQTLDMVEQDLIISRMLLDLYGDVDLRAQLAFRGGTALYKLYLLPPARYSEDIDLVQIRAEPIGDTLDRIRVILAPWLGIPKGRRGNNFTFFTEDFRRLPRSAYEGISGIFLRRRDKGRRRKDLQRM